MIRVQVDPSSSVLTRGRDALVELRGEHDAGTAVSVATTLRDAASDDGDVVVDLHAVTFMDASTLGTLLDARTERRSHGHTLLLRAPSRVARRLVELCELGDMIEIDTSATPTGRHAVTSWVTVPVARAAPIAGERH